MSEMIAYCGLPCKNCPAYIATQADDNEARAKTAAYFGKKYGFDLKPEDINCDGCLTDGGTLIAYCSQCEVRKCCREKGLENCAVCPDAPCGHLEKFHEFSPEAKACFQALIRKNG